ncbi:Snf5- protein 1 [Rhizophlyctis rosea]|nr:Snf5- protein 1 [Rhizophlyctis rosea]
MNDIYSRSAYVDSEYVDLDEAEHERLKQKRDLGDFKYNSNKRARLRGTSHVYHPRTQLQRLANTPVRLIPIRLDLEVEGVKMRDAFTWNLNETLLTPEKFAAILAEDFDSPLAPQFVPLIAQAIREQVATYAAASDDDAPGGEDAELVFSNADDDEYDEDFRIVIKLDLHVGSLHLRDQFEWPLYSSYTVSPEDFARQLAADLGVGGEFVPVIAHAIREQVCLARINFQDATEAPPVPGRPFRELKTEDEWEPELRELTEAEREKIHKEKDRNTRFGILTLIHFWTHH